MSDPAATPSNKRILICSASVGAGHNQASRALVEVLRSAAPDVHVQLIDSLDYAARAFRLYYGGGYSLLVSKLPRIYGAGFWLKDRPHRSGRALGERRRLWQERQCLRPLARLVRETQPDLIVNTHFVSAPVVARLIRTGAVAARHMVVVTDIRVHRFWYCEDVAHWFVPAEPSARTLRRWGVEPERITVSGIPIHPKWTQPLDRNAIFADWRLPADRPIVLVSGGTEFTCGPIVRIVREILRTCEGAFVAVLAGRNKDLLAELSRLPEAGRDVVGIAFTDRIHELVEVCSLMVTKAGGLTTAECLAKGTPMVLLKPVPGQESGNAAYFADVGAAVLARNVRDAVNHVCRLLHDRDGLARMSRTAGALYRPGAETIAHAFRRAVQGD